MTYCVIAIRDNFRFKSVFCRYEENLERVLKNEYASLSAAKCLVGLGDISSLADGDVRYYFRDWGFEWKYARPVEFYNRQVLREYARAAKTELVYVFEDNQWEKEVVATGPASLELGEVA